MTTKQTTPKNRVAIVGGGIAGLTAALALEQIGIKATLLERKEAGRDTGAGIQLTPNATRVLHRLQLGVKLATIADIPSSLLWLDGQTDVEIKQFQLSQTRATSLHSPFYQVYRPQLTDLLRTSLTETHLKYESVESIEITTNGFNIQTSIDSYKFDQVIAADGTHSLVRNTLYPNWRGHERYGTAFRATIERDQIPAPFRDRITRTWLAKDFHVVTYQVANSELLNCVFVFPDLIIDDQTKVRDGQKLLSELSQLLRTSSLQVNELAHSISPNRISVTPLMGFQPFKQDFQTVPAVFIGDAWHTLLPYAAQGAAMAIEDAWELAQQTNIPNKANQQQALREFHRERMKRVKEVSHISSRNGKIYHLNRESWINRTIHALSPIGFWWVTKRLYSYSSSSIKG